MSRVVVPHDGHDTIVDYEKAARDVVWQQTTARIVGLHTMKHGLPSSAVLQPIPDYS